MTPAQTKGKQPLGDLLTDVRTQIGALTIAVNLLTAQLQKPERDRITESARVAAVKVDSLRTELQIVRGRADTAALVAVKVDALLQVQCLTARGLARTILRCDR